MSTFPPIADYAFLSDCENSTLIAPDGKAYPFPQVINVEGMAKSRGIELVQVHEPSPPQGLVAHLVQLGAG